MLSFVQFDAYNKHILYISAKQELAEVNVSQNFLKVYNQKIITFFFEIWRSV